MATEAEAGAVQQKGLLAIIAGTSLIHSDAFKEGLEEVVVKTERGDVRVFRSTGDHAAFGRPIVFVQRHHADPAGKYAVPHLINHAAMALALKELGVTAVVGFNSVGGLSPKVGCGVVVIPDDYFSLWQWQSVYNDNRSHLVPSYHQGLRDAVIDIIKRGGFNPLEAGVYVQTCGPRFETKAEVRVLQSFGDILGMTGADEATCCQEVGLPYAAICMVDNMGNGIQALTYSNFKDAVKANADTVVAMARALLAELPGVF